MDFSSLDQKVKRFRTLSPSTEFSRWHAFSATSKHTQEKIPKTRFIDKPTGSSKATKIPIN